MELLTRIHLPNKRLCGQKDTLHMKRFQIELELNTLVDKKNWFNFFLEKPLKFLIQKIQWPKISPVLFGPKLKIKDYLT